MFFNEGMNLFLAKRPGEIKMNYLVGRNLNLKSFKASKKQHENAKIALKKRIPNIMSIG